MSEDLALDFGTAFTRVADATGTLLFEEPTAAAIDEDTGDLLAFGAEARGLAAHAAGRVSFLRPVRSGQLVDIDLGEEVLGEVLRRVGVGRLSHPRILVTVHVGATEVQRRALDRALHRAGARHVRFVESPLACAVGAGFAIEEAEGTMVVDVGAGRTDVGVLALGGIVVSASIASGSDEFDQAVRDYLVRHYELLVDRDAASALRLELGTVRGNGADLEAEIVGRRVFDGSVARAIVRRSELAGVLEEVIAPMLDTVVEVLTDTPPELANDLLGRGLVLAGGGALLDGFDWRLAGATGVPVHVSSEGGRLAVIGTATCLSMLDALEDSVSPASRR